MVYLQSRPIDGKTMLTLTSLGFYGIAVHSAWPLYRNSLHERVRLGTRDTQSEFARDNIIRGRGEAVYVPHGTTPDFTAGQHNKVSATKAMFLHVNTSDCNLATQDTSQKMSRVVDKEFSTRIHDHLARLSET